MKYKDLPKNNQVCLYAWRAAHLIPSGSVLPCCIFMPGGTNKSRNEYFKQDELKLKNTTLSTIRRSELWNQMRRDLIQGNSPDVCHNCWRKEKDQRYSYRTHVNRDFAELLDTIEFNEDGTLDNDTISFWDVRDTNLCNMKCIMCSTGFSSLLQQESLQNYKTVENYPFYPTKDANGNTPVVVENMPADKIRELIIPQLGAHTKLIYFAGGEPLISRMHYDMVDYLVNNNYAQDVTLFYNTNMLKLDHFGRDILDLWRKFKRVKIGASIDAVGRRAEFARAGTIWDKINHNMVKVLKEAGDNIKVGISSTQSVYTLGGMVELLDWMERVGINDHVSLNHVEFNNAYNLWLYPEELREETVERIDKRISTMDQNQMKQWPFLKKYILNPEFDEFEMRKFRRECRRNLEALIKVRGITLEEAAPELVPFYNTWKRPHEN